jgi:hypothetical protein
MFWFCSCWKRPRFCFEGKTCVSLCKNNAANGPEEMDGAMSKKFISKQVLLTLLPDWVTSVENAPYHSLKEKCSPPPKKKIRAENKIEKFLVRKTFE